MITKKEKRAKNISVLDLSKKLGSDASPFVLDVRSPFEYKSGHIPCSINIPFWAIPFKCSKIAVNQDKPVVVTCANGPRAKVAKFFLKLAGFQHVVYLDGHMAAWKNSHLPLE